MIELKVNGVFLDIAPGTKAEIERASPFFAINQSNTESSTPITISYTEKNALALNYSFQYYNIREKKKIEAELYSDGIPKGKCMLMLESATMNYNNVERTTLNGYVLFGISHFFQVIKDKKLSDLSLGGLRKFSFTSSNPSDGTNGYWQHFHQTWTDDTIPYVFTPVRNAKYYGEGGGVDWMNKLGEDLKIKFDPKNVLVPMIRFKYLLEQIFIEHGFTVDFSEMQNEHWKKAVFIETKKIEWVSVRLVNGMPQPTAAANITINLARHMPRDKTISDFLIQIFLRFGWATVFEGRNCKIVPVKNLRNGKRKDWTAFASPMFQSAFSKERPVYAFTTEIDTNDSFPSKPDLKNKRIGFPVAIQAHLQEPTIAEEGTIRYCFYENQWVQAQLDKETNTYKWFVYGDNIYNYEPDNSTETISSTIAAVPSYLTIHRSATGPSGEVYYGYYPLIEQEASKPFGYRMAFFHGLIRERQDRRYLGELFYPLCTSVISKEIGFDAADSWSNVLNHTYDGGTFAEHDYGIINFWWKPFLDYTARGEEIDFLLTLPLQELLQFNWYDIILISNIPYLVKSFIEPIPYNGTLQATLKRLLPFISAPGITQPSEELTIYAKLELVNVIQTEAFVSLDTYADVMIRLYKNAAGTIPYNPTETLYVYVKISFQNSTGGTQSGEKSNYYPVNSSANIILSDQLVKMDMGGNIFAQLDYSLDPTGAIGYSII